MSAIAELRARWAEVATSAGRRMDLVRSTMDRILEIEGDELERFLVEVIESEDDPIVLHEAIFVVGALVSFGHLRGELAFDRIRELARGAESVVVRHEATEALANFRVPPSVEVLAGALADPHLEVRATAVISLERLTYHDRSPPQVRQQAEAALAAR